MRRIIAVAGIWLTLAIVAFPFARSMDGRVESVSRLTGAESAAVDRTLIERFGSPFARSAVLVLSGIRDASSDAGRAQVRDVVSQLASLPFVTAVASPATSLDTLLTGAGGAGAIAIFGIDPTAEAGHVMATLRQATAGIPRFGPSWTGQLALESDLRSAGAEETRRAELRAVPISLVVSVWAFGGVAGAIAGVAAGVLAVLLALGLTSLAASVTPLTVLAPGVASLVGLAIGIDYALLVLLDDRPGDDTSSHGWLSGTADTPIRKSRSGTIRVAACAAAAGFAPLVLLPVSELRSTGLAALGAVLAAALVSSIWVRRIGPVIRRAPRNGPRTRWAGWSGMVVQRPWTVLALSLPPLLLLAFASLHMRLTLHDLNSLPPTMESAEGLRSLARMGRLEAALAPRVIVTLPPGTRVFDEVGWAALDAFEARLLAHPSVAGIRSIRTASGGVPPATVRQVFPAAALNSFVSSDETQSLIEVVPIPRLRSRELQSLIVNMREMDQADGISVMVGGVSAHSVDYADTIAKHAAVAIGLAVAGAFVVLLVAFRSVLVAVKAVTLNVLSAAAATGATVLAFQDGMGGSLLGLDAPMDGLFATVPLLVFCAVFGIGMDYEVFLVSRIAEARRKGATNAEAIVAGLSASADLITRSAALMIGVFVAFAVGDFVAVRMVGFALAVAVAIDATLIRLVVAPALMCIAGQWNWWPGERSVATASTNRRERALSHSRGPATAIGSMK